MTEESGVRSQKSGGKKEGRSKKKEEEKEKVFLSLIILSQNLYLLSKLSETVYIH
ncbi:hypothetical protein [Okeania sp. SIO2C2]|uniref:hypothetical protein n=1 Tax=Okeania sp. SIO2C2 TaxID=2607787 RepID=UPI00257D4CE8|nr:hypothetical protein [Okeania sp. SIO2C2]